MNKRMGQLALLVLLLGLCFGVQATEKVTIYLTDAQGTVLATEDAHGNTLTTYAYRPYGTQVRGAPANGPGYTGHVDAPDTGLVYMQARYYDPGVGRFLSSDPVSPEPGNLFNFGRYTYTNNNPINHTDPDGRCVDGLTCGPMVQSYAAGEMAHPNRPLTPVDKVIAAVGTALLRLRAWARWSK